MSFKASDGMEFLVSGTPDNWRGCHLNSLRGGGGGDLPCLISNF